MHKRTIRGVIAFYTFVAVMIGMAATPAAHGEEWHQPYGGCAEAWQAPQSAGATACWVHGWTVTAHLVVGPHGVVRYTSLPHCTNEDGSGGPVPCTWNIGPGVDGNGYGLAYWVGKHHRFHSVWATYPVVNRWHWVGPNLADRTNTSRRCVVRFGDTTVIRCPSGKRVTS